ncbi:MAG: NAD(+) synthase [Bacillota bacterium]
MPERDTAPESYRHARMVAKQAGFSLEEIDLTPALASLGCYRGPVAGFARSKAVNRLAFWSMHRLFGTDPYLTTLEGTDNPVLNQAMAFFRLKHRLRMAVLYQRAEQEGALMAGCLNLTEYLTGFFVRHGDSAADLAPIFPLYKSQVRRLARHLGVPECIITKPPSPDLLPGIIDEKALGISYEKLDLILYALKEGLSEADIADRVEVSPAAVKRVKRLVELAERFRQTVPYPELTS